MNCSLRSVLQIGVGMAVGLVAVSMPDAASAQDSLLLEEITVTAQKREQNLQDVGIAITAFSGDQLRAFGVQQSFELADFTPGVHIGGALAGQNSQFTIRGVTQNDFNDVVEAPNAVYLDEGYISLAQGQTFALFDIERVEVLKGPQGTLFGRNATGGLVQYLSRKPNFESFEGYVDVAYTRFQTDADGNGYRFESAVGGPLTSKAAFRAALMHNRQEPILNNLYPFGAVGDPTGPFGAAPGPDAGADMQDDDTIAGRIILDLLPTERSLLRFSFNAARSEVGVGPYQSKPTIAVFDAAGELINVVDVAPNETRTSIAADGSDFGADPGNTGAFINIGPRPVPGGDFFGYIDPDGADFNTSSDFAFEDIGHTRTYNVAARFEQELGDTMQLVMIADYKDFDKLLFIDVDAGPANQLANWAATDTTQFSQEVRLSGSGARYEWVAGLYYLNIDNNSRNALKAPVGGVVPGAPIDITSVATLETDSVSLFGQVEYEFAPRWTAVGGLRVIREAKDYTFGQFIFPTFDSREITQGPSTQVGPVIGPNGPEDFTASPTDYHWSGKLQLEYRPNDDLLVYFGINRGVKAGSFNAQLPGGLPTPVSAIPYDREVLLSYEGGVKWTLWDGRARINATGFYYDYKDYQAFLFTGVSGVVINADAKNKGFELEMQASPATGFDVGFGVSYFDATVEDVPLRVGGPIVRDLDPTYAPELQLNGLLRYEFPAFGGTAAGLATFAYSDEFFYNLRNFDADKFDSYFKANLRVSWLSPDEAWELAGFVNNVTDERIGTLGFDLATLSGSNEVAYQPPRSFGFNAIYRF